MLISKNNENKSKTYIYRYFFNSVNINLNKTYLSILEFNCSLTSYNTLLYK